MIIDTLSAHRPVHKHAGPARKPTNAILSLACFGYLFLVTAAWLTIRQGGDRWWLGTVLMIAPRWPFLVPLAGLWAWLAWSRRWWHAAPTAAASWMVLFPMMGFRLPLSLSAPGRGQIRVLSCNVHRQQLNAEQLLAYVTATHPDVVALQGWAETNHESLFMGDGWHVRREGELFLASRYPISGVSPLNIVDNPATPQGERGTAAAFELQGPRPIQLVNLHLASPHAGLLSAASDSGDKLSGNVERRWHESSLLLGLVEVLRGPVILMGDFNTTDDSPIFRETWATFTDAFTERGTGFGYTYRIGHTQLRIDHILAGPSFEVTRCWVGPTVGSPHRPLMADVNCR